MRTAVLIYFLALLPIGLVVWRKLITPSDRRRILVGALVGLSLCAGSGAMAVGVDRGVTRGWSFAAQLAWVAPMFLGLLVGVCLYVQALLLAWGREVHFFRDPDAFPRRGFWWLTGIGVALIVVVIAVTGDGVMRARLAMASAGAFYALLNILAPLEAWNRFPWDLLLRVLGERGMRALGVVIGVAIVVWGFLAKIG